MEAFIKVPTSGTVLAVDLCLCTWYSPFPIIDLCRGGGGSPGLFGRGRMGRGGGVWAWRRRRRRAKCLYSGPCCVKEQQETSGRAEFFFSFLSPVVCPCSLVGVGTLLVRVPGMDGVGEQQRAGRRRGGRATRGCRYLAGNLGEEEVCVVRSPPVSPVRCASLGVCWDLGTCVRAARFDLDQASPAKLAPKG